MSSCTLLRVLLVLFLALPGHSLRLPDRLSQRTSPHAHHGTPRTSARTPPSPAAQALQQSITDAIAKGAPLFSFPAGDFYFNDAALNISGASHMQLLGPLAASASPAPPLDSTGEEAQITTLYFAPGYGVHVSDCLNVTLANLVIDYSPLPYVFGPVLNATREQVTMQLAADSLTFEDLVAQYPPHDIWPPVSVFGGPTNDHLEGLCPWGHPAPARNLGSRVYSLSCGGSKSSLVQAGDIVVAATRFGFTVTLSNCSRTTLANTTIHAAGNMAITEFQGDGANMYDHVRLIPRDASHPLASNADGFHSSGLRQGPTLRSLEMKNLLDDYFNVHNTFQLVVHLEQASGMPALSSSLLSPSASSSLSSLVSAPAPSFPISSSPTTTTSVLLGDYQLFSGDDTVYATQQTLSRVQPGERISFYPLNTFAYPGFGSYVIQSISRVVDPSLQHLLSEAYASAASQAKSTPCSACDAGLHSYSSAQLYNVTFTTPLPPSIQATSTIASCDNISNTHARIHNCSFSGSNSNLGRFKSAFGAITSNTFRNTLNQNLEIESLQNWLEGMVGVHAVTVTDNVFHGTSASPVHTFGSVDVTVANNTYLPSD